MKTEGSVASARADQAKLLLLAVLAFMAIVSLWTPLAFERIAERWFSLPNILFLWPVPAADRARGIRGMALARQRPRGPAVPRRRSRCSCSAISGL